MRRSFLMLGASLLVSACAVGPDFKTPDPPAVTAYTAKGDSELSQDQRLALGQKISGDWWAGFRSEPLNHLISQALGGNNDLEAARARMAQAEETLNAARGALWPQLTLGGTVGRQKYGPALFGPADITIPPFTYYTVGPRVSFPLDLFGGERRSVEEKKALLDYQRFQLDAAYQSLTARVATQALILAAARAQIDALTAIIAEDERNVKLVRSTIDAGSGTQVQLVTAQSQLARDRTLLPDLRQQEAVAGHALAVLVGKAPAEWSPPAIALSDFHLPTEIPASLPSELVRRRPDILAAEAQLHAASAAVGVATANLYPKIDLAAIVTQQALTPGDMFSGLNAAWSLAAGLSQPVFDGGKLNAERRAAIENYRATLAIYKQTILLAFGEVADLVQALANDAARLKAERESAKTAAKALDLARRSYKEGNSGVLEVIDAERHSAEAQLGVASARATQLLDTARLHLALGGSTQTVSQK